MFAEMNHLQYYGLMGKYPIFLRELSWMEKEALMLAACHL